MTVPILNYVDRCIFTAASNGNGTFTVAGAVLGFQTPAVAGAISGKQYGYAAQSADLTQWEYGYGTLTISGGITTLTRTVLAGTNGASPVNFSAPPQVLLSVLAESVPGPLSNLFDVTITSPTDGQALVYNGSAAKWENDQRLIGPDATVSGNAGSAVLIAAGSGLGTGNGGSIQMYAGNAPSSGTPGKVFVVGGNAGARPINVTTTPAGSFSVYGPDTAGNGGGCILRGGGATATHKYGGGVTIRGGNGTGSAGGGALFLQGGLNQYAFSAANIACYGGSAYGHGGGFTMSAGYGHGSNAGGVFILQAGNSATGNGGFAQFYAGNARGGTGNGGNLLFGSGAGEGTGNGGYTYIQSAPATGGGGQSSIKLTGGTHAGVGGGIILSVGTGSTAGVVQLLNLTSGPGSGAGTLTNAPANGNPQFWIPVTIGSTQYWIPAWHA